VLPSAVPRFLTRLGASPGSIRRGNDRYRHICVPWNTGKKVRSPVLS
jgi:hypothetical protein